MSVLQKYMDKLVAYELMDGKVSGCVETNKAIEVLTNLYNELTKNCDDEMEEERRLAEINLRRLRGGL